MRRASCDNPRATAVLELITKYVPKTQPFFCKALAGFQIFLVSIIYLIIQWKFIILQHLPFEIVILYRSHLLKPDLYYPELVNYIKTAFHLLFRVTIIISFVIILQWILSSPNLVIKFRHIIYAVSSNVQEMLLCNGYNGEWEIW